MSDIPPPKDIKPSLFERMGGQPSPALAARLHGASASSTGFPAPSSTAPVFAVPVSKKPKNEDGHSHSSTSASASKLLPLHGLLERARAATERQQLDLADRYFSLAAAHYSSRFSQESTLDHASVLLLLGESTRAASIAACGSPASDVAHDGACSIHPRRRAACCRRLCRLPTGAAAWACIVPALSANERNTGRGRK